MPNLATQGLLSVLGLKDPGSVAMLFLAVVMDFVLLA
jgi:hypothetical protein